MPSDHPLATRAETETFAEGLPDEYVECRTRGHRWDPSGATWDAETRVYYVREYCARCTSERVQVMSERGSVLSSGIAYVAGYLAQGMGRITRDGRDALRLEMIARRTRPGRRRRIRGVS